MLLISVTKSIFTARSFLPTSTTTTSFVYQTHNIIRAPFVSSASSSASSSRPLSCCFSTKMTTNSPDTDADGDANAKTPLFGAEQSRLYNLVSENHRHPNGPWPQMTLAVQQAISEGTTTTTTTTTTTIGGGGGGPPSSSTKILDLASGPGEPAATIATAIPTAQVYSTDISPEMMAIANQKNISNMKVSLANMEELVDFDDDMFDVVCCCYGYMFPENKVRALEETYRVLKPGGTLVTTIWTHLDTMSLTRIMMEAVVSNATATTATENDTGPSSSSSSSSSFVPPINPLSLAEPDTLFESMLTTAKFHTFQVTTSEYPFDMRTGDLSFQLCALPIMQTLNNNGGWTAARTAFDHHKDTFSYTDETTGHMIIPKNIFKMIVAKK